MRKFFAIFLVVILILFSCKSEQIDKKTIEEKAGKTLNFPDDFFGVYKGKLKIDNPRGSQEIDMEYHFLKTDSTGKYEYKLVYNGQPRNYFLIEKNAEKGLYEVDENNGIILPTYLNNNTLHSFFEVQGNLLSSRAKFLEKTMEFEILFTPVKQGIKTGGTSEEIPEVFGYPVTVFQKAVLKKE